MSDFKDINYKEQTYIAVDKAIDEAVEKFKEKDIDVQGDIDELSEAVYKSMMVIFCDTKKFSASYTPCNMELYIRHKEFNKTICIDCTDRKSE